MTESQYREYQQALADLFPGFGQWLDGTIRAGDAESRKASKRRKLEAWYDAVYARLEMADALDALRDLLTGDHGSPTDYGFYDAIHAKVAHLAGAQANTRARERKAAGIRVNRKDETFRCWLCEDRGHVHAWHPAAMQYARDNPSDFLAGKPNASGANYQTHTLRCTCDAAPLDGDSRLRLLPFDPSRHVKHGILREDRQRVLDFFEHPPLTGVAFDPDWQRECV